MCKAAGQAITTEALTKHRKMPGQQTKSKKLDVRSTPTKKGAEQISKI